MAEKSIMTVEEYLGQYLKIEDEIQSEKDYIASLKAIVENTTTHLSFTAGRNPSKDNGKFENTMLDIVEAERKYNEKLRDLGLKQAEIANLISRVPDERLKWEFSFRKSVQNINPRARTGSTVEVNHQHRKIKIKVECQVWYMRERMFEEHLH